MKTLNEKRREIIEEYEKIKKDLERIPGWKISKDELETGATLRVAFDTLFGRHRDPQISATLTTFFMSLARLIDDKELKKKVERYYYNMKGLEEYMMKRRGLVSS